MAQVNAGRVRFVSRGEYNNSTQYYLFDLVNYEGSSYVAIGNTLGNIPTNTTYWQLVAEKGNTGSVGPEGPQGVGIASITKTATEGLVDTYTITYTNGTTSTFQVTNGEDGDVTPTEFNALKADVEDLRDNQIIYPSLDQPALEGTNIHVEDAAKARLYEFEMDKESTQETTTGKNLLETGVGTNIDYGITTNYYNGKFVVSGTLNSTYFSYLIKYLTQNIPAGTYTLSRTYTTINLNLRVTYIDNTMDTKYLSSGTSRTINFTQDVKRIQLFSDNLTSETTLNFTNYIQLEAGETATEWEPYTGGQPSPNPDYPQEVKTVKGYVNVLENILTSQTINGLTITVNNDKSININGTASAQTILLINDSLQLLIGSYKLTGCPIGGGPNTYEIQAFGGISGTVRDRGTGALFTASGSGNTTVNIVIRNGATCNNLIFKPMILENNQSLPYVPYGNNYIAVNISDGTNTNNYPIPLNNNEIVGIGDYKDELLVDKTGHCWLNKKTGKVVLNGSESGWIYNSNSSRPFTFPITNILLPPNNNTIPSILCNYYTVIKWNGTNTNYLLSITSSENNLRFRNVDITSLANFKTWLSTHNTEVYYVLATPELIDLNTKVDLKLFKEVNNVSNSEDGNMRIRYVQDTQLLFNNFDERLKALEEANS